RRNAIKMITQRKMIAPGVCIAPLRTTGCWESAWSIADDPNLVSFGWLFLAEFHRQDLPSPYNTHVHAYVLLAVGLKRKLHLRRGGRREAPLRRRHQREPRRKANEPVRPQHAELHGAADLA